jgi:predicted AlkP superfamily phosphohydrolase/phosphomutase
MPAMRRMHELPTGTAMVAAACLVLLMTGVVPLPDTAAAGPTPTGTGDQPVKVLVIGFDGMDPQLLARYRAEGVLPNIDAFLRQGGTLRELATSIPPQSPVAWSGFITGQDPGGHGIFDFIHRDAESLVPFLSTSSARSAADYWRLGSWKFPHGGSEVVNLRDGLAFWEMLADAGIDVTIFKIPSNFPPIECEARSLSGMGTPDILGTYGIFSYITDDPPLGRDLSGGRVIVVQPQDNHIDTEIPGPVNIFRDGDPQATIPLKITVDPENPVAHFALGDDEFVLAEGEWSDWSTLGFELVPMLKSVRGICRFYLMEVRPHFRLYVTPIQIDPVKPEMPISVPGNYAREIARDTGLFYTQGLPDDTKALEAGIFDDDDYVAQSDLVLAERMRQFSYELDRFSRLESGFLFFYFNSPDQTCHMTWRNMDPSSPSHAACGGRHQYRIRDVYVALDGALASAVESCGDDALIVVMSDHGFAPYNRSFHTNTWLLENGYLYLEDGVDRYQVTFLRGVDWSRTRAYALGINGLYVNLRGRESSGIVEPGAEHKQLLAELVTRLEQVRDPLSAEQAIKYAYRSDEIYHGPHRDDGPDIVLGFRRGWRGSNESALGDLTATVFEDNLLKWSGDHCMAADEVPGVILCNRPIAKSDPALLDLAPTFLRLFGLEPTPEMVGSDIFAP